MRGRLMENSFSFVVIHGFNRVVAKGNKIIVKFVCWE